MATTRQAGPRIAALRAHVAPTASRPAWADAELPPDVGAMLDVAAHLPRLGRWELAPHDHDASRELIPANARRRHRRWLALGTDGMTWLVAGWSKPGDKGTVFIVDRDDGGVSETLSLEAYVEEILEEPDTAERNGDIVAAVDAALAANRDATARAIPSALVEAKYTDWEAPELQPPADASAPLATKGHVRWLWHRTRGVVVSVTKTSLRAMFNGKAKSFTFGWTLGAEVAMSTDASSVWLAEPLGDELRRLDLATGKSITMTAGKDIQLQGIGVLPDDTLVLGERIGPERDRRSRVRVVRVTGTELADVAILEHAAMPEYPKPRCAPELPVVAITGHAKDKGLIVGLENGAPVITGTTPRKLEGIRRHPDGWLIGSYLDTYWYRP